MGKSDLLRLTIGILGGLGMLALSSVAQAGNCPHPSDPCKICECTEEQSWTGAYTGVFNIDLTKCYPSGKPGCPSTTGGGSTTPTAGGTTGTGAACQGSGCVRPIVTPNKTILYQSQTTNTTAVTNFNFDALADCPHDVTGYSDNPRAGSGATLGVTTRYPDIKGVMPPTSIAAGGSSSPDQCKVTSRVVCQTSAGNVTDGINGICKKTDPIINATAAVCPDGYVQVGAFNMQPEISYTALPQYVYSPAVIKNMDDYQYYIDNGWTCAPTNYNKVISSPCVGAGGGQTATYTFDFAKGVAYPATYAEGAGSEGVIVFNTIDYIPNMCYATVTNCTGNADTSCILGYNFRTYGPTSTSIGVFLSGNVVSSFSTKFQLSYGHVTCTKSAGLHYTSSVAPRSLICGRIKAQYDKIN